MQNKELEALDESFLSAFDKSMKLGTTFILSLISNYSKYGICTAYKDYIIKLKPGTRKGMPTARSLTCYPLH